MSKLLLLNSLLATLVGCQSREYPVSDHYDGERFFNPWLDSQQDKSFFAVMKWRMFGEFKEWPEEVQDPEPKQQILDADRMKKGQLNVVFINHSTVLLQTRGLNILTDPVYSQRVSPVSFAGPKRVRKPGLPFEKLPKIDLVLISHNHYDHLDLETLKRLKARFSPKIIVPLGNKDLLEENSVSNCEELDWWQDLSYEGIRVSLVPVQHWSARGLFDKRKTLWGGYVVEVEGKKLYFAGDTGFGPHFKKTHDAFGDMDFSLIPIGAYLPRWFMKTYHINPDEAVQAHSILGSKQSLGIHFGTFQLTSEGIEDPLSDLAVALDKRGVSAEQFLAPKQGESILYEL